MRMVTFFIVSVSSVGLVFGCVRSSKVFEKTDAASDLKDDFNKDVSIESGFDDVTPDWQGELRGHLEGKK